MTQSPRALKQALLVFSSAALLVVAGCHKKTPPPPPTPPAPAPAPAKPTVSFSADPSSINKGQSAKLTWSSTDANNVSISPEVGAVTPQGSTTVTPSDSTTYTITASGPGGSAEATAHVTVNAPPPPPVHESTFNELFAQEVKDAYFDYDKADIRADAQTALQHDADFLKKYPQARIVIEGHCDERGSTEYNLALGDRRANAVKQYLVNLGVPAANINTVSYGKEKPFCTESNESCWQQNRRGHLTPAQ
jgi:peptidoglycan-associated lipoprotein